MSAPAAEVDPALVDWEDTARALQAEVNRRKRDERAVTNLRAYLDRQEDTGETSVSIIGVRMILGRV